MDLQLADELLEAICGNSPTFFETLVIDLLLKMGYGGLKCSGEVTKKTGDGGVDGVIKQDELGLDQIYIQAKRWDKDSSVSRPEIQKFSGALLGEVRLRVCSSLRRVLLRRRLIKPSLY
ncbi:MAG: restriction endonuclease [Oscillospiraceae bacterium]|nr:restriction endonuclease [Oscillospiraceae bacterium]